MRIVGHVIPAGTSAGLADGQISLRSMSRSVDAVATRSTAALVGLDQCATQDIFDRRQVAHEPAAAFAQDGCGKILNIHRTESRVSPRESEGESSVNLESTLCESCDEFSQRDQAERIYEQRDCAGGSFRVRRRPVGPFTRHCERAEVSVAQAQRLDARDTSNLQNDEPLTEQRMKRMDDFSRSQRLAESLCSSPGACQVWWID